MALGSQPTSLPPSLSPSLPLSLSPSLPLPPFLPPSHPPSLSLPPSLPLSLSPSLVSLLPSLHPPLTLAKTSKIEAAEPRKPTRYWSGYNFSESWAPGEVGGAGGGASSQTRTPQGLSSLNKVWHERVRG